MSQRLCFLVRFIVNVTVRRTGLPDQARYEGIVRAVDEAEARKRIQPLVEAMGGMFTLKQIDVLEDISELPKSVLRYLDSRKFDVVVMASQSEAGQ